MCSKVATACRTLHPVISSLSSHYVDAVSSVLIPHGVIQERVKKMARNILEDVLQERATKLAATNICLTQEEQQGAVRDIVIEEKCSFAGLMDLVSDDEDFLADCEMAGSPEGIIQNFNDATSADGDQQTRSDLRSYGLELADILASQEDHRVQGQSRLSPRLSQISIRSLSVLPVLTVLTVLYNSASSASSYSSVQFLLPGSSPRCSRPGPRFTSSVFSGHRCSHISSLYSLGN